MQIKTIIRDHCLPIRTKNKSMTTANADKETEKVNLSYNTGGDVKWNSHSRNEFDNFFIN